MGTCLTCWELSDEELEEIIRTKQVWVTFLTFGKPVQPLMLHADKPMIDIPKRDNRICRICDGGPGNEGVCLCGAQAWEEA